MFSRKILVFALLLSWSSISCLAQENKVEYPPDGVLVVNTLSYCRGSNCKAVNGDLLYIKTRPHSHSSFAYISAHMEYKHERKGWTPVPAKKSGIGVCYSSGKYGGVRDFIKVDKIPKDHLLNISLFVPYDAMALSPRKQPYERRYVIRLWDNSNNEIENFTSNITQSLFIENKGQGCTFMSTTTIMQMSAREDKKKTIIYVPVIDPVPFTTENTSRLDKHGH